MTKLLIFPAHLRWVALGFVVALGYLFDLGGDHIPRNGDELVYANIARLTAASGHWLPLQSAWDFMRNTKPPLLFWQAMVAGGWGEHWSLLRLRLPSIFYTWAVTLMVGVLASRITKANVFRTAADKTAHPATTGAIAALVYLSFFTTYRYGRPYMTSAPETFWLCGIFLALAWSPTALLASKWKFPLAAALALGLGCLYKSFAMVVPVGFGLALCYQVVGAGRAPWAVVRPGIALDAGRVASVCGVALGIFSLWFVLDPQPGEVWREFVVGENAGKFKSSPGYFKVALGGGGFLTILTGYFSNALFLLPVSVGCAVAAFKSWRQRVAVSPAEQVLWLWMLALMLVFMLPNQRSTRYLIAAMPALAVLMALYWQRIGRVWFVLSLSVCAVGALAMAFIAYSAISATQNTALYSPLFGPYLLGLLLACASGVVKPQWTRPVASTAAFGVLLALAGVTQPFNTDALARFRPASNALLQGQTVAVPSNFNGHFERYEFIIPGAKVVDYFAEQPVDVADTEVQQLLQKSRFVLVQRRLGQAPCTACHVIDERWDLRSRQDEKDGLMAALKTPGAYWFAKEYLVERLAP